MQKVAGKEAAMPVDLSERAQSTINSRTTAGLQEQVQRLTVELAELTETLLRPIRLRRNMAIRCLLDAARAKIAGHTLSDEERGQPWNDTLCTIQDFKGLSKEAAMLTKFGPAGTQQWLRSPGVHSFDEITIAEAVTAANKNRDLYGALFEFVYQKDAGQLVSSALADDDD